MAKNFFKTARGDAGIEERISEAIADAKRGDDSGGPLNVIFEGAANWALERYDLRIRARLGKAGLKMPDDGPLTVEDIREKVRAASGLELEDLTQAGITQALDLRLAAALSSRLGFTVTTVMDVESMKSQIKAAVVDSLKAGGVSLVPPGLARLLRNAATLARAGVSEDDKRKIMNRIYQKRYRRRNLQKWA